MTWFSDKGGFVIFGFVKPHLTHLGFQLSTKKDKIVSAEFEWKLISPLQRHGKDCISMEWTIDLSDGNWASRQAGHAAQFLREVAVNLKQMVSLII